MAYSNGYQTVVQSMNGILSFNDGSGTIIENGTISTQSIALNNIPAVLPATSVSLWNNLVTANAFIMNSLTNGTIYIGTALSAGASGVLRLGNSVCTVVLGSFTFLNSSIQTSLTTTLNLFSTYVGATANLFTAMTTGTINIGTSLITGATGILNLGNTVCTVNIGNFKFLSSSIQGIGGAAISLFTNINYSTADLFTGITTGIVNIGTGMTATGSVKIGNSTNTNQIGTIFVNDKIISTTSGNSGLFSLKGTQRLAFNNDAYTQSFPAYISFNCEPDAPSLFTTVINYVGGGYTNRIYDVKQRVISTGAQAADGRGILQTYSGSNENIYQAGSTTPRPNPTIKALEFGYTTTQDDASFINAGGSYGGISLGGCGSSNPSYSTVYQRAMTVYPHYGTRLYTGGLSFDKGNLTSAFSAGRGFFMQSGRYLNTTNVIAANGSRTQIILFTTAFGGTPTVTLGPIGSSVSSPTSVFIYTIYDVVQGSFSVLIRNSQGVANVAGTPFGFNWIALGGY